MQPKWVAFTGTGSAKVDTRSSDVPGRQMSDYLALPISQYSLLDPQLVERCAPVHILCSQQYWARLAGDALVLPGPVLFRRCKHVPPDSRSLLMASLKVIAARC